MIGKWIGRGQPLVLLSVILGALLSSRPGAMAAPLGPWKPELGHRPLQGRQRGPEPSMAQMPGGLTAEEGHAVYWSRSRGKLWRKGETSGHQQVIRDIRLDCDEDVILQGPVTSASEPSITILGVTFSTNAGTEFENLLDLGILLKG